MRPGKAVDNSKIIGQRPGRALTVDATDQLHQNEWCEAIGLWYRTRLRIWSGGWADRETLRAPL